MQFEDMAEIKQEVDNEADGIYDYSGGLCVEGLMHVRKRSESLEHCTVGQADMCLQDNTDFLSEHGHIGITVMEQDTNGQVVMVLRSQQLSAAVW